MSKKIIYIIVAIVIVIIGASLFIYFTYPKALVRPREHLLLTSIGQARTMMVLIDADDGNYDNFNCDNEQVRALCEGIVDGGGQTVIVHNKNIESTEACIYSFLPYKSTHQAKDMWYCADSAGHLNYTETDPGSPGYCVDGQSAVCPPNSLLVK